VAQLLAVAIAVGDAIPNGDPIGNSVAFRVTISNRDALSQSQRLGPGDLLRAPQPSHGLLRLPSVLAVLLPSRAFAFSNSQSDHEPDSDSHGVAVTDSVTDRVPNSVAHTV
jgi:hypothetical protein